MRPVAERILDAFQLTRLSLAFGAVCELWLVTLLTRADPRYVHLPVYHMPLWKALICTGVVSVGLFAFAASLNDLLDVRHDRRFSPDRPLAAGRIRTSSAALLSFGALMAAVVCASALGEPALVLTVGVAAATSARARASPTECGRNQVPPRSGISEMRTKAWSKRAERAAKGLKILKDDADNFAEAWEFAIENRSGGFWGDISTRWASAACGEVPYADDGYPKRDAS
jgi:hypothetical protein